MAPDDLALALRLADEADAISMRYFTGQTIRAETKADGSPVTDADREIERHLRQVVANERPGDAFIGEEFGQTGTGPRRWIVDGIDGTYHFAAGNPWWSTLIALEVGGEMALGVMSEPARATRTWAARGEGAWMRTGSPAPVRLHVSTEKPDDAPAVIWSPWNAAESDWRRILAEQVRSHWHGGKGAFWQGGNATLILRPDGDPAQQVAGGGWDGEHAALAVARGEAGTFFDLGGDLWDHAALACIVEEAGGRVTDFKGGRAFDSGAALYTNGHSHEAILKMAAAWLAG